MASEANSAARTSSIDQTILPFAPAWVDRLVGWINQLPIPAWLFYSGLLGFTFLAINVSRWVEGTAPVGALDAPYAFEAIYPVSALAAIHYLDRTARRAFDSFRQALGRSEDEAARLEYELTVLPAREALIVAGAGFAFTALAVLIGATARLELGSGIFYWTLIVCASTGMVMTAELLYHTHRQLRVVSRIHALAANLDLFHFAPLYSFSALTARTGLVFGLILWFDLAFNPETLTNLLLLGLNAAILSMSVACFIFPLEGMHRRIVVEKRQLEWDVNQRVAAIVRQLYGKVDALDLHDADAVNKTISSLVATRELIAKIPTWPWRPETFTAFFSALALPIVVFLIQTFLKTLIGIR